MFFHEYCAFEINEVLKIERGAVSYATKKRNISSLSCRILGKSVFVYEEKEITTDTGTLLFIPRGVEYSQRTEGEEVIVVHLNLYQNLSGGIELFSGMRTMQCVETFKKLYDEWNNKNPGFRHRCTSILYELLADIIKYECSESNSVASRIANSVIFMKRNFANPYLTMAEIARQSCISEIYFRKLWERLYGKTPGRFLATMRIEYAKSLLAGTDYSVAEIAERAGFLNAKYFSTKFKKETGLSPGKYRSNYNN